jgi:acetyl esterase/lipase
MSYDATINSSVRTFGLWYDSSHAINDPTMPIAVFIHGGGWTGGSAYSELGKPSPITPGGCTDTTTAACYLASIGYAVYSINYTLTTTDPATKWPAQWQDCDCFMKFLAEEAGVSVPGNPQAIYLFGHSAGAHLSGMTAIAPHNAFPTNCSHTSTNYSIKAVSMESAPLDLITLAANEPAKSNIIGLLGCDPSVTSDTACIALATSANPATYVAAGQPPTRVASGMGDTQIPYATQGDLQAAYAALTPPVVSQWTVYGLTFSHDLDLFYYSPCSNDPDGEPSPCGSAGTAFTDILAFFAANGGI